MMFPLMTKVHRIKVHIYTLPYKTCSNVRENQKMKQCLE